MEARLRAVVRGRVQGVGFRWFVESRAARLGLKGEAWNREDGAVEVVAEGPEVALRQLCAELEQGPPMAVVDGVDVEWLPAAGDLDGFRIG